ncbi:DUF6932 family protein [Streptomyces sp. IB201691-2A2]|uniref:DUF6932 family protein n=1 Tax=Streptomyces sp. IB201691-2A2 TaxID=2561920 RepID=UPI00117CBE75|nr:hypothetical protein [Streptomyces sp. IB201691-2A2]TRO64778.1 hypothetical protein E4K73_15015 [Streptomyces sp. IB201691-2A2]
MTIPPLDPGTGYLPEGEHEAEWKEVVDRFGTTFKRKDLLMNLAHVLRGLRTRGVQSVLLDGSFVTNKQRPRDVEVIYFPPPGADVSSYGEFSPAGHDALKRQYKIDLWPYPSHQPGRNVMSKPITITEFFSTDREGEPKGLIRIKLEGPNDPLE